ncbi:MAG TPA: DUF1203 domain-containing protein [Erythrobacter sp.]|nr:DUF1203 domain-containing protein [Erythrobacter sp.]
MAYIVRGLDPKQFSNLFAFDNAQLEARYATRVVAGPAGRYPCRVSLLNADPGDELLLMNHNSHDVRTPYRNNYAIYVRKDAKETASYVDELPPVLRSCQIALRGYNADGNLIDGVLALDDNVDEIVRTLFADDSISYIHAHNAAYGCFAALVERYGDEA